MTRTYLKVSRNMGEPESLKSLRVAVVSFRNKWYI